MLNVARYIVPVVVIPPPVLMLINVVPEALADVVTQIYLLCALVGHKVGGSVAMVPPAVTSFARISSVTSLLCRV